MKSSSFGYIRTAVILLASATLGLAQTSGYNNPEPYGSVHNNSQTVQAPQSVRPGSLNYVEGQVSSNGQVLTPQAVGHFELQPGQSVATATGYAEILLTPGAFLRVGPNSEVSLASAGLSNTRIDLIHGSAMIEADQVIEGTQLQVGLGSSNTAEVLKKGLYSFDAGQQSARVLDGKLKVVNATSSKDIGKGDQIVLANGDNLKKTDFSMSQAKHDPLYVWSEARSRDEAGQNLMAAQNYHGYAPVNGGWFWDPYASYYGFWPTSAYLYSPFGFGFYGYPGFYGGFYPGFYGGSGYYRGGYHGYRGVVGGGHVVGSVHSFGGGGFHGGGGSRGGGGSHGGGGHR